MKDEGVDGISMVFFVAVVPFSLCNSAIKEEAMEIFITFRIALLRETPRHFCGVGFANF